MKKLLALTFVMALGCTSARAVDWWLQPTICRLDSTYCYGAMYGPGYAEDEWDSASGCRGMKYVCSDALMSPSASGAVLMGREEIARGTGIKPDFDVNTLNKTDGCFGARRTASNGTQVSLNGQMVNVWCPGVLSNPTEFVDNGEIVDANHQPTCRDLAEYGYTAALTGKCYGKYYDPAQYYIECGADIMPTRLIRLNGAIIETGNNRAPADKSATDALFDKMYNTSQSQKKIYFK